MDTDLTPAALVRACSPATRTALLVALAETMPDDDFEKALEEADVIDGLLTDREPAWVAAFREDAERLQQAIADIEIDEALGLLATMVKGLPSGDAVKMLAKFRGRELPRADLLSAKNIASVLGAAVA